MLLALPSALCAAPPSWAGGNGGNTNANIGNNWSTGNLPGNSELARLANGKMTLLVPLEFGALEFSGGIIDGSSSLTLSLATSTWTGGEVDTATLNVSGLTIGAGATKKVHNNGRLNLSGPTTWSGGDITTASGAQISNAGSFSVTFDGRIAHEAGTRATFTNSGTFTKSTTAGVTEIAAVFNNTNALRVETGILKLTGGGTNSAGGNVHLDSGATLQLADNNYVFAGGNFTGTGTIEVTGATTTFNGAHGGSAHLKVSGGTASFETAHTTTGDLTLTSGTVDGASTTTATVGRLTWQGGDITTTGVTTTAATTIGGGSGKRLLNSARLTFGGDTTWDGSTIQAADSTQLTNQSGVTFSVTGDGQLTHTGTGNRPTFTNAGTFTKSGGATDSTEIQATFDNTGIVNANSGRLKLTGGGTSTGNFTIATDASVTISGHDYTFNAGTLAGSGTIEITGATATFNSTTGSANLQVNQGNATFAGAHSTTGALTLAAGNINGNGTASVGSLAWHGGTINGTTIATNGATIGGNLTKQISGGGQLNLGGITTWGADTTSGSPTDIHTAGASTKIKNTGTFTTTVDGTIEHDSTAVDRATFRNEGTFIKASTTSGETKIRTVFDNAAGAAVNVNGGTLKLEGGGTSAGHLNVAANSNIVLGGTDVSYEFTGGALNGEGTLEIQGVTASFNGTSGNATIAIAGGTAKFDGAHHGSGNLSLASGFITGNGSATLGALNWDGGNITQADLTVSGATIGGNGSKKISDGAQLTLTGNSSWSPSSAGGANDIVTGGAGTTIKNTGQFTTSADGTIGHDTTSGGRATFRNEGTFSKSSSGTTGTTEVQTKFDNTASGVVNIASGKLKLTGGGSSSGNITTADGSTLELGGQDYAFTGGVLGGNGTIDVTSGTASFSGTTGTAHLKVNTGATARFDGTHSGTGTLDLTAGTLTGTGTAEFGSLNWSGGALGAKVKSTGNTTITGNTTKSLAGELTLAGNTAWDGSLISTTTGAKIQNETGRTFTATGDGLITGAGTFKNDGTFTKNAGTTDLQTRFENNGAVQIDAGTLRLSGGGRNAANASIIVESAAALVIAGDLELSANSTLSGGGLGRLLSGTLSAHGTVRVNNFHFEGGSFSGTNSFTGTVDWLGGNWNSAVAGVSTTIESGGVLNLRSHSTHEFSGRSILNDGTVNWYSGDLRGGNGSVFTNNSVFNDLAGGNKSIAAPSALDGSSSFTNNGKYRKTDDGTTTVAVPFTNNGSLEIAAGSIVFSSTFTNSGSINLTNGASAQFSTPLVFGANAPLTGVGTINAPLVTAAGDVAPGVSPGALSITGSLTLLNTSSLLIELGGPGQGSDYDFLSVGGAGILGGNLGVTFLNGYQWSLPDNTSFTILTASAGLTGAFANVASGGRLATLDGAATFQVNFGAGSAFGANSVVLSNFVVAVPEPSTYVMMALGGAIVLLSLRRRKK